MAELIAGILLVAGALYLVLKPVFQPRFAEVGKGDGGSVEGGEDPDDDLSPGAVALRALKEIEFDRATGKLSDADYDALKAELDLDRKSTRLNSSHLVISYAVFC